VAIAHAVIRLSQVELLVFDDPTAALDPTDEHEIYRIAVATGVRTKTFLWVRSAHPQKCPKYNGYGYIFRTIAPGRMTVVVSYRLALALSEVVFHF